MLNLDPYDEGYLMGILVGEGHFGGDGRQAQITLRMHVRHEKLFRWLEGTVPGSKLYGPYHHGGRHYYQWMVRGEPLRQDLLPILLRNRPRLDDHIRERIAQMLRKYRLRDPELEGELTGPRS